MKNIGEVDRLEIIVLIEDYTGYDTTLWAQFGPSFLLDIRSGDIHKRILMDTSLSAKPILHNMDILGIDPSSIDMVFLSHCHDDHTGGLVGMLKAIGKQRIPIIAHPTIFRQNYWFESSLRYLGITENDQREIRDSGAILVLVKEPFELCPGVVSTGEVERVTDFEISAIGAYNVEDGKLVEDQLLDDMSVVVNVKGKGLVIVTGCGHAGVINIIRHSRKITGIDKVEGIIGGFHLIDRSEEQIGKTVEALLKIDSSWVVSGHCTGFEANKRISTALGDKFSLLHAGKKLVVSADNAIILL